MSSQESRNGAPEEDKTAARDLFERGPPASARAAWEDLCRRHPQDAEAWLYLGRTHGRSGAWSEAAACARRAIALAEGDARAHILLSKIHAATGEMEQALRTAERAVALAPGDAPAHCCLGYVQFAAGRHGDAAHSFQTAAELDPAEAGAHYNLGNLRRMAGDPAAAAACYRRAVAADPGHAAAHHNLAMVLASQGRHEAAERSFRDALRAKPDYAEAGAELGRLLRDRGRAAEAEQLLRSALALRPDCRPYHALLLHVLTDDDRLEDAWRHAAALPPHPQYGEPLCRLAAGLYERNDFDRAAAAYEAALKAGMDVAEVHYGLGQVHRARRRYTEAVQSFRRAVGLDDRHAAAFNGLGAALYCLGDLAGAVDRFRRALALRPEFAEALSNCGVALKEMGEVREAEAMFRRALELAPGLPGVRGNLGAMYNRHGDTEAALALLREAEGGGESAEAHGALLMTMNYGAAYSPDFLSQAAANWDRRHAAPLRRTAPHRNDPDPARRLRIGYVSADFHHHPVGMFMEPVLRWHDAASSEVFCYYNGTTVTDVTTRLMDWAHHWRDITGERDAAVAERIEADAIDILVDLSGHTAHNRLLVFARKPAPVQVTWLGYFFTTGMEAMDYIVADRFVIRPGEEALYAEQVVRMPHSYECYEPPAAAPEVTDLPALACGHVTFGCFNNPSKITPPVVRCWARLLEAVPDAVLLLKYKDFDNQGHRQRIADMFSACGIGPQRLRFSGSAPHRAFIGAYRGVDIALDPFPYNGGITTLEALWMGVPVVTLRGDRFVSRIGDGLLSTAGLPECVAGDEDGYVRSAAALAHDLTRLAALRRRLRPMMQASPLCDGRGFVTALEEAYRGMWRRWCLSPSSRSPLSSQAPQAG